MRLLLSSLLILTSLQAYAQEEAFVVPKYDGGKIACNDDRGPEIKQNAVYLAPKDRFFVEDSIKATKLMGWGVETSCSIANVGRKNIKVKTDRGELTIPVIDRFTMYVHANCGSGIYNNSGGKSATVECQASANMIKYTNE
jgi:hypothetical protein